MSETINKRKALNTKPSFKEEAIDDVIPTKEKTIEDISYQLTEEETANPDIAPEEEPPVKRGRKEGWTKTAYDELEAAEMIGRKRRMMAEDNLKLEQHDDEEQQASKGLSIYCSFTCSS